MHQAFPSLRESPQCSSPRVVTGDVQPSPQPKEGRSGHQNVAPTMSGHPPPPRPPASQPVQPPTASRLHAFPSLGLVYVHEITWVMFRVWRLPCSKMLVLRAHTGVSTQGCGWGRSFFPSCGRVPVHPADIAGSGVHSPTEAGGRLLPCGCCGHLYTSVCGNVLFLLGVCYDWGGRVTWSLFGELPGCFPKSLHRFHFAFPPQCVAVSSSRPCQHLSLLAVGEMGVVTAAWMWFPGD